MRCSLDCERLYREQQDPWSIGNADSERYELYRRLVLDHARLRGAVLDVGCGFGAFLARFQGEFASLQGVEVSEFAIAEGRRRYPFIEYTHGSADELESVLPGASRFDAIIYSDVIYYLSEQGRRRSLRSIADHLESDGLAFIAAWAPGGEELLDPSELRRLIERELAIEESLVLDSDHAVFICRPRRVLCAVTVDYETWQPLPEGMTIDWDRDVLVPTARLLDIFDAADAELTIMAEMGEYFWLLEHRPEVALQMEAQWREVVSRGHDVQLHLHPAWLPELGAHHDGRSWRWNEALARAHDYPGDLTELLARCKTALEQAIRTVVPAYEVSAFRAGGYEAQPFARLHDALQANGITCDSSVLPGDCQSYWHHDYRHACSAHQPYYASRFDPQLEAPPAERALVELPACVTPDGKRWTFDNERRPSDSEDGLPVFLRRLRALREQERRMPSTEERRRRRRASVALRLGYQRLRRWRRVVNRLLPRSVAHFMIACERERPAKHEYFVMVAHTKADLDFDAIAAGLRRMRSEGIEVRSLSELARIARAELERSVRVGRGAEAARQVRQSSAALSSERNAAQARELLRRLPPDRRRVLDLGRREGELPFPDGAFDCVYANDSLEYVHDVTRTLTEIHRVLAPGALFLAAIPADGLDPTCVQEDHTWKTTPVDLHARLHDSGFVKIEIDERDLYRQLGGPPYPPARDTLLFVRAWSAKGDRA